MNTNNSVQPNVVMIVLDQLRYDSLGFTSGDAVKTPNIDRIASSGAHFENAFNHLPTCCPSRQSMLNGQRPEAFGAHWNYDIALPISTLSPDMPTWTSALKRNGYKSSYFGKWHVSPDSDPVDFGYDHYVGQEEYVEFRNRAYPDLVDDGGWEAGVDPVALEDSETHWFANNVRTKIQEYSESEQPWHVRLDLVQPHLPCRPVEEFAKRYDPEQIAPWASFGETFEGKPYIQRQQLESWGITDWSWEQWAVVVARYFGIIEQVDHALGRVFDAVEESGQAANTLIIFTTDHGDMCGSHRMMDKHYVLYDDVIHVPLILAWPGVISPQSRKEMVYNVLDLVPTIANTMGLGELPGLVGRDLMPLLVGQRVEESPDWRDNVVSTYNGQQFGLYTQRSIRTETAKYIFNATDVDEFYDLLADPDELVNAIDQPENVETIRGLRQILYETLIREGDRQVDNAWIRRQLLPLAQR